MTKYLFIVSLLIVQYSFAQVGTVFPNLKGTTLSDKQLIVPVDTKGKFTLIGLAYSQKAEQDLQTWFQPVFTTFIEKTKPGLFNDNYDVNLYFVPMFTGANQAAAEKTTKYLKEKLDKVLVPHVLIYKGELKDYKQHLKLEQNDTPYFFVLDKDGKIVHTTSGRYTDEKLEKIEAMMEEE